MADLNPMMSRHQVVSVAALALAGGMMASGQATVLAATSDEPGSSGDNTKSRDQDNEEGSAMKIHYLEIVTKDVEAICTFYSKSLGVTFGEPDMNLGNAQTAELSNGGLLGVRAPMHAAEQPVVRPYILVKDIEATVAAAKSSGAEVMVSAMKLGPHGTCAIVSQSGLEAGFWQV